MRWISALTGLLATATAVAVLAAMSVSSSVPPSKAFAAPVEVTVPAAPATVVTEDIVPDAPVGLAGVSDPVSSALREAGYAQFVGVDELAELPASVLDALVEEASVLVIAEEG
jgi:hypothetical protein